MKAPDITRLAFAIIFLLGAVANAAIGIFAPSTYETFADASILSLYEELWTTIVYPQMRLFLLLVVALELSMAWLLLVSGVRVKAGLILALGFVLGLIPFWWQGGAVINLLLALPLLWLLRYDYPRSIPDVIRERRSKG
ncbi:MAG: hypothetical protein ACK2UC_06260 [Anaerolineae bacterium]|jgi:hypothetical protein